MYITRPQLCVPFDVELSIAPHVCHQCGSRILEAILTEHIVVWNRRSLYECAGGVVNYNICMEEDVLNTIE
jgi:hypothetical protein